MNILFIGAGHGKTKSKLIPWKENIDPGACRGDLTERRINQLVARQVVALLKAKLPLNWMVLEVGINTDATVDKKRIYVNDVLEHNIPLHSLGVELHCNASKLTTAKGVGGYFQANRPKGSSTILQRLVEDITEYFPQMKKAPQLADNHANDGGLYIRNIKTDYCLLEMGFISNLEDVKILTEQTPRYAEAIAHSLLQQIKLL